MEALSLVPVREMKWARPPYSPTTAPPQPSQPHRAQVSTRVSTAHPEPLQLPTQDGGGGENSSLLSHWFSQSKGLLAIGCLHPAFYWPMCCVMSRAHVGARCTDWLVHPANHHGERNFHSSWGAEADLRWSEQSGGPRIASSTFFLRVKKRK